MHHFRDVFNAGSGSEAWASFKTASEAMPAWAIIFAVVLVITVVANSWVVPVVATVGCTTAAVYFTVKHAVREALREHDSQSR